MSERDAGFLARWSRLKQRSREQGAAGSGDANDAAATPGVPPVADAAPDADRHPVRPQASPAAGSASASPAAGSASASPAANSASVSPAASDREPDPAAVEAALPPVESLTPESDFRPFMRAGTDSATRNAALKRLFADPQFNVMDGLDVYIDDYGKTEPIPPALLGRLLGPHAAQESGSQLPESRSPQSQSPACPPDSGGDVPVFASSGPGSRGGDDKARIEATQGGSQGNALDRCGKGAAGDGAGDGDAAPVASHPDVRGIDADPCPDVHRR